MKNNKCVFKITKPDVVYFQMDTNKTGFMMIANKKYNRLVFQMNKKK